MTDVGKPLRLDSSAASASPDLPAFLARPAGAPVYHGFPIVPAALEGWVFGTISDYEDPEGCERGDAFVVAPDGARAGIIWRIGSFEPLVACPPDEERWGVYSFAYQTPIRTTADFVRMCHSFLPELRRRYEAIKAGS